MYNLISVSRLTHLQRTMRRLCGMHYFVAIPVQLCTLVGSILHRRAKRKLPKLMDSLQKFVRVKSAKAFIGAPCVYRCCLLTRFRMLIWTWKLNLLDVKSLNDISIISTRNGWKMCVCICVFFIYNFQLSNVFIFVLQKIGRCSKNHGTQFADSY